MILLQSLFITRRTDDTEIYRLYLKYSVDCILKKDDYKETEFYSQVFSIPDPSWRRTGFKLKSIYQLLRISQLVQRLICGWLDNSSFESQQRQGAISFSTIFRPSLGSKEIHIQWESRLIPGDEAAGA